MPARREGDSFAQRTELIYRRSESILISPLTREKGLEPSLYSSPFNLVPFLHKGHGFACFTRAAMREAPRAEHLSPIDIT